MITRDATRLAVGQVFYTPWCDERGKVIDDGTISRLDESSFRWTAADPCYRWLRMNSAGLDVEVRDVTDTLGALALQGPRARAVLEAASGADWSDVGYFRRRAGTVAGIEIDVTRTGYTGDLGYELWVDAAGAPRALGRADRGRRRPRPAPGRDPGDGRRPGGGGARADRGRLHERPPRADRRARVLAV